MGLGAHARAVAVCDGFGSIDGIGIGQVALKTLAEALHRRSRSARFAAQVAHPRAMSALLVSSVARVNAHLYARSASHEDYVTGGASLTLLVLAGQRAYLAHLGTTAAYLSRAGYMVALTKDDTCEFEPASGGSVAVRARPPILTRALGVAPHVELSVCSFRVSASDTVVLTTKRLTDLEDRRALSEWLLHAQSPQHLCDRTIALVPAMSGVRALEVCTLVHLDRIAVGVLFALGLLLIS